MLKNKQKHSNNQNNGYRNKEVKNITPNESRYIDNKKIVVTKNPVFNQNDQNYPQFKNTNFNNNNHEIDPRLKLTLNYLDINSTLPTFVSNNISFNDLLLLSRRDLVELGFSMVERNRILYFSQQFIQFGHKYTIEEINSFFRAYKNLNLKFLSANHYQPVEIEENFDYNTKTNNFDNTQQDFQIVSNKDSKLNEDINLNNNIQNNPPIDFSNPSSKIINQRNLYNSEKYYSFKNNNDNNIANNNDIKKNNFPKQNDFFINNDNVSNCTSNYTNKQSCSKRNMINDSLTQHLNQSRLNTLSKNLLATSTNSSNLFQKYQELTEEVNNYMNKYNAYKQNWVGAQKKYQNFANFKPTSKKTGNVTNINTNSSANNSDKKIKIIRNKSQKKNSNSNYINNNNYNNSKNNYNNSNNNYNNNNNNNNNSNINYNNSNKNYNNNNDNNINNNDNNNNNNNNVINNKEDEIDPIEKLRMLKEKKEELQKQLMKVNDKSNQRKMIIKYLEEKE